MRSPTHEAGATVRLRAVGGSDTASGAKLTALATSAVVRSKASVFLLGMGDPPFWGRRTSSTAAMVRRNVKRAETGTEYPAGLDDPIRRMPHTIPAHNDESTGAPIDRNPARCLPRYARQWKYPLRPSVYHGEQWDESHRAPSPCRNRQAPGPHAALSSAVGAAVGGVG